MPHPTTVSPEPNQSISMAIVSSIADCEEVTPTDLPPLYNQVDTDALDSLSDHRDSIQPPGEMQVSFDYFGYEVLVTLNGIGQHNSAFIEINTISESGQP